MEQQVTQDQKERMSYIMGLISQSQKTRLTFCNRFGFTPDNVQRLICHAVATDIDAQSVDVATQEYALKIAKWAIETNKWGLLLCGNYGCGKTTMAKAFATVFRQMEAAVIYPNIISISALDLCSIARTEELKFAKLCEADLIILDDVGTEPTSVKVFGTDTSPVVHLLYKRYDNRKPILITTNLTLNDFYSRYGERVRDRAKEMFSVITMTNGSRR